MIEHSESVTKIAGAVMAVQRAVDHVTKGSVNPHFKNTYADLNTFLTALRGPIAENGMVLIQGPGMSGEDVTVDTLLIHTSGEWIRNRAAAPMPKSDPQGAGSAITYLRRYSLAALFAIPQEDDDGEAASPARPSREDMTRLGTVLTTGKDSVNKQTGEVTEATCPKCTSSGVWDNREKKLAGKFSAKSPDYSCKDKGCGWALWIPDARNTLSTALEKLVLANVITAAQMQSAMNGTAGGDLDVLSRAQDWVNTKAEEAGIAV